MSPASSPELLPVTLDNCDHAPIHVPGLIQPHGALLAFDAGARVLGWSLNAAEFLGEIPHTGLAAGRLPLDPEVLQTLADCIAGAEAGEAPPVAVETEAGGGLCDAVVHGHRQRFLLELERRDRSSEEVAAFALKAHRAIDRLKRHKTVAGLLSRAVEEVRELTGFDRVMAYRFRHDDSGDVVAEARRPDLGSFLGMRYPASDIPAQARRLYTINTLRLIADVGYRPVPVLLPPGETPLDMSHAVLRSVSPIHVEYLRNMGVEASMSVSIVVNDRLWGLLACHHESPRQVPYAICMACDVLAQVLAATVQSLEARERAEHARQAAEARTALAETLLQDDDMLRALFSHAEPLRSTLGADAILFVQAGRVIPAGDVEPDLAAEIARSMAGEDDDLVVRREVADWPADVQERLGSWVGLLGLRFDPATQGWLLALRPEQVETVRWAGRPDKERGVGPLGPRLTPRGSFEEWRETVRGTAEPWDEAGLEAARGLLATLHRASNAHHAETERARTQMLAILGHDLRDPLQSINMAAQVLERVEPQQTLSRRILTSSGRMQRLIGQMLDLSRLRGGLGLEIRSSSYDLTRLIEDLIDEAMRAHPGASYEVDLAPGLVLQGDPDRIAQVTSNLLGNARHHGTPGHPIRVRLTGTGEHAVLEVKNAGAPIDDATAAELFSPFKKSRAREGRDHRGLGLGLYIAHEIVVGHGGRLSYRHQEPEVVFVVELPRAVG